MSVDDPLGTGGERTLVASYTEAGDVAHVAVAYHGEPDAAGTSLGACCCGWRTEGPGPSDLVWPAIRAHVLAARP